MPSEIPMPEGAAMAARSASREQLAQMLGLGFERDPLVEILQSGESGEVRAVMRLKTADMEEDLMMTDSPPNSYKMGFLLDTLGDRVKAVKFLQAVGKRAFPQSAIEIGLTDKNKRKEFTESITQTVEEVSARLTIAEKVHQDMAFADDIGGAAVEAFVRAGKARAYIDNLRKVVRAPETEPGFGNFGEKVDRALGMLVDIGEGKAKVRLSNGKEKLIPNIFAISFNHGLLNWVIDYYIEPTLSREFANPSGLPGVGEETEEDWKEYAKKDNRSAAICAMVLMKYAKIDTTFGWGIGKNVGKHSSGDVVRPEDIEGINLEGGRGLTGSDLEKLYIEIRRSSENGLKGRREHPRPAGALSSLGCYPTAFVNLMEVMSFDIVVPIDEAKVIAIRKKKEEIEKQGSKDKITEQESKYLERYDKGVRQLKESVSVWEVWRTGVGKKVSVDEKGAVTVQKFPVTKRKLADIPMDEVELINAEADEEYLEFKYGVNADVREVPYGLALMYAAKNFFDPVMRTDFAKLYEEVISGDSLLKMNKGIDVFLGIVCAAKGIPEGTMKKLNNYIRTVFLGSLYVSLSTNESTDERKTRQIPTPLRSPNEVSLSNEQIAGSILQAASVHNFIHDDEAKVAVNSVRLKERELFQRIKTNRICPKPSETGWFSKAELKILEQLYPFGV